MPATELERHRTATEEGLARPARVWPWYLTVALVSAHFALSYVGRRASFLDLHLYAAGRLGVPFQYRTLIAWIFRGMVASPVFVALSRHAPSLYHDPYLLAYLLVAFTALAGSVLATAGTIYRLIGDRAFARWSALLVVYMAYFTQILMYGLTYTLPYDLPSLFFFCAGINLIVRNNLWLYYLLFIPAVFNRETICFLTVIFAVWQWCSLTGSVRSRLLRILPHVAAQAAIWIAVKVYLFKLYEHNLSDVAANRVFKSLPLYNLKELATPGQWPLLLSISGFAIPLLIAQRRWIGHRALAWCCAIVLPLWALGMFLVGVVVEVRVFTEVVSLVAPAVALIVFHRYYRRPGAQDAPRPGEAATGLLSDPTP